ncbi:MAG: LPS export ABC transporter permease LptF [Hydrogenophilaceae bacterium]|nr:LPS export ABC transporter permease LptF [Hydrogenophilaceae bacterium]
MRIHQRALIREMTVTAGYALAGLAAIVAVTLVARIFGRAALGDLGPQAILPFIGFSLLQMTPVLLSLSLFMGVFLTLNRYWRDSEMVIWLSSGLNHLDWIRPVLLFALPICLTIALLSMVLLPWAAQKRTTYESYLSSRDDSSGLSPGLFVEAAGGKKVYFVEAANGLDNRVRNLFIRAELQGRTGIIVAQHGQRLTMANGDPFLVLENGRRYEGKPGSADYRMMEFERYSIRLEPNIAKPRTDKARERSTLDLLRQPTPENQAEWGWRVGYPLSALILALFAIPLSFINPRAGRSLSILFAILVYAIYNNLIGLSEGWVAHQSLTAGGSMLLIHGSMTAILALIFWLRMRGAAGLRLAR